MKLFLNRNRQITAIQGSVVFIIASGMAWDTVRIWSLGQQDGATAEQKTAAKVIESLIRCDSTAIGHATELRHKGSDAMKPALDPASPNNPTEPLGLYLDSVLRTREWLKNRPKNPNPA